MKHIGKIITLASLLLFTFKGSLFAKATPSPTPTATPLPSSYELFYPVVAGKIPGDKLYPLKLIREWLVEKLVFDKIKNADYHLILSKKRLVETEALIKNKADSQTIEKTLKKVVVEINQALKAAATAQKQGKKTKDMFNTINIVVGTEADFIEKSLSGTYASAASELRNLLRGVNYQ